MVIKKYFKDLLQKEIRIELHTWNFVSNSFK